MARLGRADVNMPDYDGFALTWLHNLVEFEAEVYSLLDGIAELPTSRMLYYRHAEQHPGQKTEIPKEISGRRLMVFDKTKGDNFTWSELSESQKVSLISSDLSHQPSTHIRLNRYDMFCCTDMSSDTEIIALPNSPRPCGPAEHHIDEHICCQMALLDKLSAGAMDAQALPTNSRAKSQFLHGYAEGEG